ncbi:unnamed protein product, partial [Rotaria sp. Silwood1]
EKLVLTDKALFNITDKTYLTLVVLKARDLIPPMTTPERYRFLNLYCKIIIGSLTLKTPFMKRTNTPK